MQDDFRNRSHPNESEEQNFSISTMLFEFYHYYCLFKYCTITWMPQIRGWLKTAVRIELLVQFDLIPLSLESPIRWL